MRNRSYAFESVWRLSADAPKVFEALRDYDGYPSWWPDVRSVHQLEPGDAEGIGMVVRYVVASPLLYSLAFDVTLEATEAPRLSGKRASGHLVGTGVWRISEDGDATEARFAWNVATTQRRMNLLAPIAAPIFSWAHARVMRRSATGLAVHLGAREAPE